MNTDQIFQTLKECVAEAKFENRYDGKFKEFNTAYIDFLKQYPEFNEAYSATPAGVKVINPIFGHRSFYLNGTNDEQADALLENGRAASKVFGRLSLEDRKDFLAVLEQKIALHQKEIALTIVADTGKPVDLSAKEMDKGAEWFTFAKEEMVNQLKPRDIKGGRSVSYNAKGVAQIIGAYNYPYALAIGGIVGGLSGGNGAIVSAPLKAPNWVFPFTQAANEAVAEFTAKALGQGKLSEQEGEILRKGLIQHSIGVNVHLTAEADMVHFVGSDKTGKMIAAGRPQKKTVLEMGGGSVALVMNSAYDVVLDEKSGKKQSAEHIAQTIFAGFGPATGQRCTAPRVVAVQEGKAEAVTREVMRLCAEGVSGGDIGNPFEAGIKIGPLVDARVDQSAHQKMQEAIKMAKAAGATVSNEMTLDKEYMAKHNINLPLLHNPDSYWVRPLAIDLGTVKDKAALAKIHNWIAENEVFGPLTWIAHPVKDLDAAIALTNKLDHHKLAGSIFTNNNAEVNTYRDETRVTSLETNAAPKDQSPYGPHGHPNTDTIGGDRHFRLYVDEQVHRPKVELSR